MQLKKRLLALVLALALMLPVMLLSPALPTAAQTTSDLYGTGSADEINIIKLLDMALNRGGMSMSSATMQAFLEYWWNSVSSDLSTCIDNADAAITTTQAFVEYLNTALESADHYDKLGSTINNYIQYVFALEYKSLSDFKQLLLQPGTFRQFLLSYVTDEDGNIANTVDNKIKKYNIGKTFVNMTRQAADAYIEEYEGYYLVPSCTYKDLNAAYYSNKGIFDVAYDSLKTISDDKLFIYSLKNNNSNFIIDCSELNFIVMDSNSASAYFPNLHISFYDDEWKKVNSGYLVLGSVTDLSGSYSLTKYSNVDFFYVFSDFSCFSKSFSNSYSGVFMSSDSRVVKIWKSLDAFKAFSVGQSNIYYSNTYSSYDSSVDNSIEFTGSYYSSNSNSYSHDVIQNNIDNSSEVNESTVNNITNQTINNITNIYGDSSGSGGSGSGSGNSWWNIGDGIDAFIEGVAALLDFLLAIIGKLIGLLSSFATGLLEIMGKIAELGQGFSNFLTAAFGFIPEECISLIIVSVGVMCALGIFKLFKK